MCASPTSIFDDWKELTEDFKELETSNRTYLEKLDEVDKVQKKCIEHVGKQKYRLGIISRNLKELKKNDHDKGQVEELENKILKRTAHLEEIEQTLPKKNGVYLRIILGNVNVSILNKEAKFKYKDDYEKFKLVLSIIGFIFAILNLCVRFRALELCNIFLLVWYYCTLTIRESILKVNGSKIKGWWRLHHFISTVAAAILLIWPDQTTWLEFRNQFMWFNVYLSVVQYLQFIYQRGQLYRLKALGERHNMDITIEGFHSWMSRGLSFLIPFLFVGYIFQLYNAYVLYQLSFYPSATWHIKVLSWMFLVLFIGNATTTTLVIPSKFKERVKQRYKLMSQVILKRKKFLETGAKEPKKTE
ncbi:transmembrane protein 120 homolog [Onthophagus taurus]|uniref:transmembrane protein 120 homolog n=1 Tax=Onthophagus taurus TaxID=166361 RepID=UPI000C202CCA|nr:transmembrane protein 120 homolog [Onthophagus taurus]